MNEKRELEKLTEFASELGVDMSDEDIAYYYGMEKAENREWCYERSIIYIYEQFKKGTKR